MAVYSVPGERCKFYFENESHLDKKDRRGINIHVPSRNLMRQYWELYDDLTEINQRQKGLDPVKDIRGIRKLNNEQYDKMVEMCLLGAKSTFGPWENPCDKIDTDWINDNMEEEEISELSFQWVAPFRLGNEDRKNSASPSQSDAVNSAQDASAVSASK